MKNFMASPGGKAALALVLFAAAGVVAFWQWPRGPLPEEVNFICVETGTLHYIDRDDVFGIPANNPKTGRATLVPCYRTEAGQLAVSEHFAGTIEQLAELNHYVDPATRMVKEQK